MKAKPRSAGDKPSPLDIQQFFNEMSIRRGDYYEDPEYKKAKERMCVLDDSVRESKEYKALEKSKEEIEKRYSDFEKQFGVKKAKIRREYLLKGSTPAVLAKMEKLMEEINTFQKD